VVNTPNPRKLLEHRLADLLREYEDLETRPRLRPEDNRRMRELRGEIDLLEKKLTSLPE
jgi:hypothetical protein